MQSGASKFTVIPLLLSTLQKFLSKSKLTGIVLAQQQLKRPRIRA
jgi:hypothetical protein